MLTTEERLSNLEIKLERIESLISPIQKSSASPVQAQPVAQVTTIPLEKKSTGNILGLIGVLCFAFAAIYLIKLSIDSGWLTPLRQVVLATTLGFSLIGFGFLFKERDQEYFSYLPAAGVAILYLATFGLTTFYNLISPQAGIIISLIISIFCLFLYDEFKFNIYQIIAGLGAYVLPLFLNARSDLTFTNIDYLLVSVTFTVMSVYLAARPISLIGAYLAIAVSSKIALDAPFELIHLAVIYTFFHFLIYASGILYHSIKNKKALTESEALSFLPILLFFYAVEYNLITKIQPNWAPLFSFSLSALLISFYFIGRKRLDSEKTLASGNMLFSATLIILTHSIFFSISSDLFRPPLFLIFCLAFYFFRNRIPQNWIFFKSTLKLVLGLVFIWNYFEIFVIQSNDFLINYILYGFAYGLCLIFVSLHLAKQKKQMDKIKLLLCLAHAISIFSIYNMVKEYGSLVVSFSWAAYALIILMVGYQRKDQLFAKSSIIVLMISTIKVLTYDLSEANSIVRVICLMMTGGLLYFSGFIFRRIDSWNSMTSK